MFAPGGFDFGGFNQPSADQHFSTDAGFLASQNATTETSTTRHSAGQCVYPFTVSLIWKSFIKDPQDFSAHFFGDQVSLLRLVGMVRELAVDDIAEKWSFKLDDSTGSIHVEWRVSDQRGYEEPGPSPWMKEQLKRIQEYKYVSVYGTINILGKSEPTIMAYNVKPVDIHEEIFFHQIQVAQEIVRKICPSGPSPSVPVQQPAERDRNSFSPKSPSRFAQPPYGSGRQKLEQPVLAARSTVQTPLSFYEPMKQQEGQSSVSGAIVEILKNTSAIKPQGMTDDEILITLIGKGMNVDSVAVQRECRALVDRSMVFESNGRWKLTNF